MTPDEIVRRSRALKRQSLEERLTLLRDAFPDAVADAEHYLATVSQAPWEHVVLSRSDEVTPLRDRYNVGFRRRRPPSDEVSPLTDLFFEACELIIEQGQMVGELANDRPKTSD